MPRRGYPPTGTWRTFLRKEAFAIGAIGLGEAVGYQTSFLLSSAAGSRELSGASPNCRHIETLSSSTDCSHIALPIILIGAPLMVVSAASLIVPPI
jgi:hypothetical protein